MAVELRRRKVVAAVSSCRCSLLPPFSLALFSCDIIIYSLYVTSDDSDFIAGLVRVGGGSAGS